MTRYEKQQLFAPIGEIGQRRLENAHVMVVGLGALGSSSAETLTRAGVGKLTIIDRDYVEESNLHRQQLYTDDDAARMLPKAIAAKQRLQAVNKNVNIESYILDAKADNLEELLDDVDVIMDGSDNFEIRFIMNDLAAKHGIPFAFGACAGAYGMTTFIKPWDSPCLQCLLSVIPGSVMTCDSDGVIAPAVQQTALLQTTEVMKYITGNESAIEQKLTVFDLWKGDFHRLGLAKMKKESCSTCGLNANYPYLNTGKSAKTAILCGRDTVQVSSAEGRSFDLTYLETKLHPLGKTKRNPFLLSFQTNENRLAIFKDGRVLVHGTKDESHAQLLYEQFILN